MKKIQRVNWHEAAVCAMQIELRDYAHLLDFYPEYVLGKNSYRIDLLVIRKLSDSPIPKNIARIFTTYNIFEIKGVGSSVTPDSYYKANAYAGLLISSQGKRNQYTRQDISLSFLGSCYPRKLFRHLTKDCKLTLEKISPGVYHIHKEMYATQVLVTSELPPEENLYLHCMRKYLSGETLEKRLSDDYEKHMGQDIYVRYMNQVTNASFNSKGESTMVCEGILNICGTSSKEIEERAIKATEEIYIPQINKLAEENERYSSQINKLTEDNERLQHLLSSHGIAF